MRADDAMSKRDVIDLRYRLSRMSLADLRNFYETCHYRCRCIHGYFPGPRDVQELIQAWKAMRKFQTYRTKPLERS